MNIRHLEDMITSRMEYLAPINNGKSRQVRQQDRNEDSVNTSAISNMLSQNLQRLIKDNDVRHEKIEHFKNFVTGDHNFSDNTVDKILSNIIKP